jgi:hypothetical protein
MCAQRLFTPCDANEDRVVTIFFDFFEFFMVAPWSRRTQSHKRLTKWYVAETKNGGAGPHFSQKQVLSAPVSLTKNVKSIAGSKGLSPLAGVGTEPQKNFASPLDRSKAQ